MMIPDLSTVKAVILAALGWSLFLFGSRLLPEGDSSGRPGDPASFEKGKTGRLIIEGGGAAHLDLGLEFRPGELTESDVLEFRMPGGACRPPFYCDEFFEGGDRRRIRLVLPLSGRKGRSSVRWRVRPRRRLAGADAKLRIIDDDGERLLLIGRGCRVEFRRDLAVLVQSLEAGPGGRLCRVYCDVQTVKSKELQWSRLGPESVEVQQSGTLSFEPDGPRFSLTRRIRVNTRAAQLRVHQVWSSSGAVGDSPPIAVQLELGFQPRVLQSGAGGARKIPRGSAFSLRSRAGVGTLSLAGRDVERDSERPETGALRLRNRRHRLELAIRDFLLSPGAAIRGGMTPRVVDVQLSGERLPWRPGRRFSQAFRLRWGRGASGRVRGGGDAVAFPSHASRPRGSWSTTLRREFEEAVVRAMQPEKGPHAFDWPGDVHRGDWLWARGLAGNLEFDTTLGLWRWGMRRREAEPCRRALRSARHLLEIDRDREASGLFFRHGRDHRGPFEFGHVWLEGLFEVSRESAEPVLHDGAMEVAVAFSRSLGGVDLSALRERSFFWSLLNLSAALHHLGVHAEAPGLSRLTTKAFGELAKRPGAPWFAFDRAPRPQRSWLISTWGSCGILGEALHAHRDQPEVSRLAKRWIESLRRTLALAWNPKEKTLAKSVLIPLEGGEPRSSRRSCTGEEMLFFACGLERAVRLGAPPSWLEISESVARAGLASLRVHSKKFRGKELSQLLWVAAHQL